jgi:uncharacterized membrane protein HdeD (DUF308 family)
MATTQSVVAEAKTLPKEEQKEVVKALGGSFKGVTDQRQLGTLYFALLSILAVIAILSGMAAFVLFANSKESAGTFMTVVTTIVGGLVGLFAPSPVVDTTARARRRGASLIADGPALACLLARQRQHLLTVGRY